jgi:hypothetical protein
MTIAERPIRKMNWQRHLTRKPLMGQQLLEALRLEANLQIFKNSYDAAQGILATLNSNDSKLRYNSALRVRLLEMCEERLTAAKLPSLS